MTEKILFFFSALGVFNAALLMVYLLLVKRNRQVEDYFLGTLLFLLVIRVGMSCFQYFGNLSEEAIKLGLVANLLMGPAVFFLIKAQLKPEKPILKQALFHLGLWTIMLGITWFAFDFEVWDWRIRFVIHAGLTIYLISRAWTGQDLIRDFLSKKSISIEPRRATIAYLSLVLICVGFAISLFTNYILGPLLFSVIFYGALGFFLSGQKQKKKQSVVKKINTSEFEKLNEKLIRLMEEENLYRNPELNLELLAKALSVSRHLLSQLLNDNLNKNFHQFINDYRVREACELLRENGHYSIEAIGNEVGFHSRSSFFSSFKRLKGMTPAAYRKQEEYSTN